MADTVAKKKTPIKRNEPRTEPRRTTRVKGDDDHAEAVKEGKEETHGQAIKRARTAQAGGEMPPQQSPYPGDPDLVLNPEALAEDAQQITAAKQVLNTSDGSGEELEGDLDIRVEEVDYDENVEQPDRPTAMDYQEDARELHEPEDVEWEDWPHAGVAENDPAGVAWDDPAGTAPKDDNYEGDAVARAEEIQEMNDPGERTETSQAINTSDPKGAEEAEADLEKKRDEREDEREERRADAKKADAKPTAAEKKAAEEKKKS